MRLFGIRIGLQNQANQGLVGFHCPRGTPHPKINRVALPGLVYQFIKCFTFLDGCPVVLQQMMTWSLTSPWFTGVVQFVVLWVIVAAVI